MDSFYLNASLRFVNNKIFTGDDLFKAMIVSPEYVFDPQITKIDTGADETTNPAFCEIQCKGYKPGFRGTGRRRVYYKEVYPGGLILRAIRIRDLKWISIGGQSPTWMGGIVIYREGRSDQSSLPVGFQEWHTEVNGGNLHVLYQDSEYTFSHSVGG